MPNDDRVDALNRGCQCITTEPRELARQFDNLVAGASANIREAMPHAFSSGPVFIGQEHVEAIVEAVRAIESVGSNEDYRAAVLASAPPAAAIATTAKGVLFGYDFHLTAGGPKLIEINTNAGGLMLNLALGRAQAACCPSVEPLIKTAHDDETLERRIVAMFEAEAKVGNRALRRLAIVDLDPPSQFLHPELLLFAALFERYGIDARIADPRDLTSHGGAITHRGDPIDLVYNRLTDFYLEDASSAAIAEAWRTGETVVTPHPAAYALLADKRNLAILGDAERLRSFGVPHATSELLVRTVPTTRRVRAADSASLWAARKQLFFKPATGFGSRATYAGRKLTRKTFDHILASDYVAQELIAPSERTVTVDGRPTALKVDVRAYTYAGELLVFAARVYSGQVTNFRTPGGGFAPLFVLPAIAATQRAAD